MPAVSSPQVPRAALIVLGDDVPSAPLLGQSWPEFRIGEAIAAGAVHIVVVVTRVTPDMVSAVDWARNRGVSATLARTTADTADHFHPDEAVLLMSGDAVADRRVLDALAGSAGPSIACLSPDAGEPWELIDARGRWTGFARIDGTLVRATASIAGDWDLASTLLRRAVAGRAKRMMLDTPPLRARDPAAARLVAEQRVVGDEAPTGWGDAWIVRPVAEWLAVAGHRFTPLAALAAPWLALAAWAAAPVLGLLAPPAAACAMLVLASLLSALSATSARMLNASTRMSRMLCVAADVGIVGTLLAVARPVAGDLPPVALAVAALTANLLIRRIPATITRSRWLADAVGQVVVVGVASLFGPYGLTLGIALAAVHAAISLGWLQDRLSSTLTRPR